MVASDAVLRKGEANTKKERKITLTPISDPPAGLIRMRRPSALCVARGGAGAGAVATPAPTVWPMAFSQAGSGATAAKAAPRRGHHRPQAGLRASSFAWSWAKPALA